MSSNYLPVGEDVLSVIRYLGQQNVALELTKSFRGIMVQQDVNIIEVNPEDVTFRAPNIEMCTALEGDVYLHSRLFPKPVMARLKSLDISQGKFVLSGFTYTDSEWKKRQYERVQPKHPTYVTLHWKGEAARACIENISVDGMAVLAYKLADRGMKIQTGANIQLDFQLSPDHKYTALKGTVIYLNTAGRFITLIGIRLFPKAREARLLEKYIAYRKQEILVELNQTYWEFSKPRGVESLYF